MRSYSLLLLAWLGCVSSYRSQSGIISALASISGGGETEKSWFEDMEFEDTVPKADKQGYDDNGPLDELQLHPLLQIPLSLGLVGSPSSKQQPVRTFCDTGAQRTIMSMECAERSGLLHLLDRRYAGKATGVGSCRVLGRLPPGVLKLRLHGSMTMDSPAITVIESTGTPGVEFLLGLDLLREYGAVIDLQQEELRLTDQGTEYRIPFLRPRRGVDLSDEDQTHSSSSLLSCENNPESDDDDICTTGESLDMSGL